MPKKTGVDIYAALYGAYQELSLRELELPDSSDPETLHQYRVAIRRVRSVISLISPAGDARQLNKKLQKLSHLSNHTRDMDMLRGYLIEEYSASPVIALIQRRRDAAFVELMGLMRETGLSNKVKSKMENLLDKLKDNGKMSQSKVYSKINKELDALEMNFSDVLAGGVSDPVRLHSFRKKCKWVRYQCEVTELAGTSELIEICKKVQSILGKVHDYHVWLNELQAIAQENGLEREVAPLVQEITELRNKGIDEFNAYITKDFGEEMRKKVQMALKI